MLGGGASHHRAGGGARDSSLDPAQVRQALLAPWVLNRTQDKAELGSLSPWCHLLSPAITPLMKSLFSVLGEQLYKLPGHGHSH